MPSGVMKALRAFEKDPGLVILKEPSRFAGAARQPETGY
jgi:hypothetical protein